MGHLGFIHSTLCRGADSNVKRDEGVDRAVSCSTVESASTPRDQQERTNTSMAVWFPAF
jgi:hypothetical protein